MVSAEEHAQVLAEEIEVLESIYIDELDITCLKHRLITRIKRCAFAH